MTLLYMYFENGEDNTYKGIKANPSGYRFDNRFNIEFDKDTKTFNVIDNPNYVQIYNEAISNFSCIVGRNGSGKTTFFELLITNIAWGITYKQPTFMISIYYQVKENNEIEFFIQNYQSNANSFTLKYNNDNRVFKQNKSNSPYETNMVPDSSKFIFHSLSPFDKIFYSIGLPFKKAPKRIPHFKNKMQYIGNQNIFKNDPKHEIQTITNLMNLFSNEYFSKPFEDTLGYKFSKIDININNLVSLNEKYFDDDLLDYIENLVKTIEDRLESFKSIEKYSNLQLFKVLDIEEKKNFFLQVLLVAWSEYISDKKDLIHYIIIDNIDFFKLTYPTNLNKFLNLLDFKNLIKNKKIKVDKVIKHLLKIEIKKESFFRDYTFLSFVLNNQEKMSEMLNLENLSLAEIKEANSLPELIDFIRKLKNRGYIEFELNLKKNEQDVNYFYLSSGEKTMMSYFANLAAAISDFKNIKNKTFIIFIDEVELHLHPEWQRSFIDYMNKFFRENKLSVKFQFIIATHSPFVLSDIVEEQIVFINQDEKKSNDNNTFGANIYDIFEKGFFLENSIGKCSENYIQELSNIVYLFKALQHITKHKDYFLIRNYLQQYYEIDTTSTKSITSQKRKADKKLYSEVLDELKNSKLLLLKNKFSINAITKYLIIDVDTIKLTNLSKYIDVIGEPTIKIHLSEIYADIKEFVINAN